MDFADLIAAYPQQVQQDARTLREFLLNTFPELNEQLDPASHLSAYNLAPGMKGIVFTLLLSKTGVKIGINRGSEIPDPAGLLEGTGKVHKYIRFTDPVVFTKPDFLKVLNAAMGAARSRLKVS